MGSALSRRRSTPSTAPQPEPLQQFLRKEEARRLINTRPSAMPLLPTEAETKPTKFWKPFSQVSILSGGSHAKADSENLDEIQLLGVHNIGSKTFIETVLQGTRVQLEEFRLTFLRTLANSLQADKKKIWKNGQITVCAATDIHLQHQLTLESILGSEENGLTFATVISTDLASGISWGVANSYRPYNKLTLFSRFTSDAHTGKRLILQAVQKLNDKNMLSPVYAATLGNTPQAGISWTHQFNSGTEDSFQVKALCNKEGSFSFNVKARLGEV